jgi:hypothetical protein
MSEVTKALERRRNFDETQLYDARKKIQNQGSFGRLRTLGPGKKGPFSVYSWCSKIIMKTI